MNTPFAWSMNSASSSQALLIDDPSTWSLLTLRNARQLVMAMHLAGVSDRDADMQNLLRAIERFQTDNRDYLEAIKSSVGPGLYT